MLIEDYDLDVFTPPCEPGAERFSAIARLTTDFGGAALSQGYLAIHHPPVRARPKFGRGLP